MGVREIMLEFMKDLDPAVKEVLAETIAAEQRKIDMKNPTGIKNDIRDIIDARVRAEERKR